MRIFAIGDTHLSRGRPKPMHIFGEHWRDHEQRIRDNWNAVAADDDLLLIAGDISWATRLDEARADLAFLAAFRGRKLLLKGNHDYWWTSLSRVKQIAPPGIDFLQNDAWIYDDAAIAGTRGWVTPAAEPVTPASAINPRGDAATEDRRHYARELERLRRSLDSLRGRHYRRLIVMMHYPPIYRLGEPSPFSELVEAAGADVCVYGHLHGHDIATAAEGERAGVNYKLVSADAVDFHPWLIARARERPLEQPTMGMETQ
jgi:predicted phosphohydrolase